MEIIKTSSGMFLNIESIVTVQVAKQKKFRTQRDYSTGKNVDIFDRVVPTVTVTVVGGESFPISEDNVAQFLASFPAVAAELANMPDPA